VQIELVKYQALGNDFLVLVDAASRVELDAGLARALCDRHLGLGADGLIHLVAPRDGGSVRMELYNADGGVAETSGNGLRCAALAALDHDLVSGPEVEIETLLGRAAATVTRGARHATAFVRVDMGELDVGGEVSGETVLAGASTGLADVLRPLAARRVDVANPHVVLYHPGGSALPVSDVSSVGAPIDAGTPGGANVEIVLSATTSTVVIATWERGAGVTLACGSGSCAAAAACRAAGFTGDVVEVVNPGGTLKVELAGPALAPRAILTGPVRQVARLLLDTEDVRQPSAQAPTSSGSAELATSRP
jgi:diaminopimelate epimerase